MLDYASQNRTVQVAAYQPEGVAFSDGVMSAERMPAVRMTSGVFRILETPPLLGRTLTAADDQPGAACAVVLSDGLWRERLAGFRRPSDGACASTASRAKSPVSCRQHLPSPPKPRGCGCRSPSIRIPTRGNHGLMAVGRLKPGVPLAAAREDLRTLMTRWTQDLPHHKGHSVVIAPMRDELVFRVEQQLSFWPGP